MNSFLSFLDDIPPIFLLIGDKKDLSSYSLSRHEKEFLVKFVSTFNIEGKTICSTYNISYEAFRNWRRDYSVIQNPLSLLRESSNSSLPTTETIRDTIVKLIRLLNPLFKVSMILHSLLIILLMREISYLRMLSLFSMLHFTRSKH